MYFPCDKHAEYCDEVGNASVWSVGIHNRLRWLTATMARREKKTFMVKVEKYWRAHKGVEGRGVMCLSCVVLCRVAFSALRNTAACAVRHGTPTQKPQRVGFVLVWRILCVLVVNVMFVCQSPRECDSSVPIPRAASPSPRHNPPRQDAPCVLKGWIREISDERESVAPNASHLRAVRSAGGQKMLLFINRHTPK